MKLAALLASLALLDVDQAAAVDSQCQDATPANPAQVQDWRAGIKLCTPMHDDSGLVLEPGELERCTILANGTPYATVASTTPGQFFLIPPMTTGPKRQTISATCEGQGGTSVPTPSYDALLRRGKPGRPVIKP